MKVSFVVTVQYYGLPATMHEVLDENELLAIIFSEVIIFNADPALVWNVGVTVKETRESDVCMDDSLLG